MTSNNSETFPAFAYAWKERRQLGWNTPEDYMSYVHPHWRSFDAINPMLHYILAVIYIIIMFTGLVGNAIVIWIFSSTKRLRTPSNILVVNLALLDFIMMSTMPVFVINSLNEGPIWGKLGCDVYAVLGSYSGIGGAMSNAAIAYDRYRTIARPFDGKLNGRQAWLIVLAIWLWATPFSLMPWFGTWGRFVPEGFLTTCSFDYLTEDLSTKVFVGTIFVYSYVIPISSPFVVNLSPAWIPWYTQSTILDTGWNCKSECLGSAFMNRCPKIRNRRNQLIPQLPATTDTANIASRHFFSSLCIG